MKIENMEKFLLTLSKKHYKNVILSQSLISPLGSISEK